MKGLVLRIVVDDSLDQLGPSDVGHVTRVGSLLPPEDDRGFAAVNQPQGLVA